MNSASPSEQPKPAIQGFAKLITAQLRSEGSDLDFQFGNWKTGDRKGSHMFSRVWDFLSFIDLSSK